MIFSTPMMKQYGDIKKKYPDSLLFFRMGDFYELFLEDAHIGASVLNITLTKKSGGKDGKIPMAGVPYHAVDTYIAKLVKSGYKVAICEQLSPPNKKGLVKRDVVRVVTPGTLLDERNLEKNQNNNIASIYIENDVVGIAIADLSTGFFATEEFEGNREKIISDIFSNFTPIECILPDTLYNEHEFLEMLSRHSGLNVFSFSGFEEIASSGQNFLTTHFRIKTLESFSIEGMRSAINAAAGLLGYLKETQKNHISHIQKIGRLVQKDDVTLDRSTIINLELLSTIREHDTKGSLLNAIDHTITPMGGRLIRTWLIKPLGKKEKIEERHTAVMQFTQKFSQRDKLRDLLKEMPDTERLTSRLSVGLGNARDILNLRNGLYTMIKVREVLEQFDSSLVDSQIKKISHQFVKLVRYIDEVFESDPPVSLKDGGIIRQHVDEHLDTLKKRISKSKSWIVELEKKERERTGISSLKVRFNKVFGFYIEISKANLSLVPDAYIRKQTLVNAERFITEELKEHEEIVLTAEEKIKEREYELFCRSLTYLLKFTKEIQDASKSIAVIDTLASFSFLSQKEHYVMPKMLYSGEIRIKQGRHPVVEQLLKDNQFVPNDTVLDNTSQSLLLITGPNMAGKSVYIRQVAIIVLLSHMGCFVPAQSAHISVTDRIFVRSGASDVITSGLSTFMVEMVETAHILNSATEKSLIVMDEIGRGTSTYDGISIAWAVVEYLVTTFKSSPKTLFATHYHELIDLEKSFPHKVKNFHMAVTEERGEPIFLHAILPGGASHSFGVSVAKLAGIPNTVIKRASELLSTLEKRSMKSPGEVAPKNNWNIDNSILEKMIYKELENLDIANMTPLEALQKLSELKDKLKIISSENRKYIEID